MSITRQSTPLVRFGRLLVVLAVCASLGLHWATLQTVAWTQMFVGFSKETTLAEAVSKTFDGEHPCELCMLVEKGQKQEKNQDIAQTTVKLKAVLIAYHSQPRLTAEKRSFVTRLTLGESRREGPPSPPPRA